MKEIKKSATLINCQEAFPGDLLLNYTVLERLHFHYSLTLNFQSMFYVAKIDKQSLFKHEKVG